MSHRGGVFLGQYTDTLLLWHMTWLCDAWCDCVKSLVTFPWLFLDSFMTFVDDFFLTLVWLLLWLFPDFLSDFFLTFVWLFSDFLSDFLFDFCLTFSWLLSDSFLTFYPTFCLTLFWLFIRLFVWLLSDSFLTFCLTLFWLFLDTFIDFPWPIVDSIVDFSLDFFLTSIVNSQIIVKQQSSEGQEKVHWLPTDYRLTISLTFFD